VDDQLSLSDFAASEPHETELYVCEICDRGFDSAKGRGIHRAKAHDEEEIKQVLITELQRLANKLERTPELRDMNEHGAHSSKTYQKKFGSWNEAIEEAGFETNKEGSIAKSDLRDELERLADQLGRTPTSRDMAEDGKYATSNYSRKFGSWNDAVREVGLEPTRDRDVPREELIDEIQRLAEELGGPPTVAEMKEHGDYGVKTCSNEFGTWNEALKTAGVGTNREKDVAQSDLLAEIHRLNENVEGGLIASHMRKMGKFSVGTYGRKFGSWNDALRKAGVELSNRTDIPKSELLAELERLNEELGRTPTVEDMWEEGRFGSATYETAFGSWNDALREANLDVNVRSDIPEKELLSEIQSLSDEISKTPESREMDQRGKFDSTTYSSRFGSWNEALKQAGFDPLLRSDIPESELIDEIHRLADTLNRPPTRDEMEYQGRFSSSIYSRRFGTWTDSLIEAGYGPHKALNPDYLDHRVDSAQELVIADILLDVGVEYENEGIEITYDDGRTYTPDFVTESYVIEVKGQDWGELYGKEVTAKSKAEAAMNALDERDYVVIGTELPADIHVPWPERETIRGLFE
jgi:hypothetical protein